MKSFSDIAGYAKNAAQQASTMMAGSELSAADVHEMFEKVFGQMDSMRTEIDAVKDGMGKRSEKPPSIPDHTKPDSNGANIDFTIATAPGGAKRQLGGKDVHEVLGEVFGLVEGERAEIDSVKNSLDEKSGGNATVNMITLPDGLKRQLGEKDVREMLGEVIVQTEAMRGEIDAVKRSLTKRFANPGKDAMKNTIDKDIKSTIDKDLKGSQQRRMQEAAAQQQAVFWASSTYGESSAATLSGQAGTAVTALTLVTTLVQCLPLAYFTTAKARQVYVTAVTSMLRTTHPFRPDDITIEVCIDLFTEAAKRVDAEYPHERRPRPEPGRAPPQPDQPEQPAAEVDHREEAPLQEVPQPAQVEPRVHEQQERAAAPHRLERGGVHVVEERLRVKVADRQDREDEQHEDQDVAEHHVGLAVPKVAVLLEGLPHRQQRRPLDAHLFLGGDERERLHEADLEGGARDEGDVRVRVVRHDVEVGVQVRRAVHVRVEEPPADPDVGVQDAAAERPQIQHLDEEARPEEPAPQLRVRKLHVREREAEEDCSHRQDRPRAEAGDVLRARLARTHRVDPQRRHRAREEEEARHELLPEEEHQLPPVRRAPLRADADRVPVGPPRVGVDPREELVEVEHHRLPLERLRVEEPRREAARDDDHL